MTRVEALSPSDAHLRAVAGFAYRFVRLQVEAVAALGRVLRGKF